MSDKQTPKFVPLDEFATIIGRPLSTIRRWASERRFPLYKCSNRIVVNVEEGVKWFEQFHITKGGVR